MNVLFVGTGSGGSWEIRGKQIGRALGARVTAKPSQNDWDWADVIVLVKHAAELFGWQAIDSGARVIWDVLDWWKQPEHNDWPISEVLGDVEMRKEELPGATLIGATHAMAEEIGGVCIPHHFRPGMAQASVRDRIEVIAYEGTPKYLGSWKKALNDVAKSIGATFVINPKNLADADVVVAFRGEKWDGPICRRWKSGVKIVNAVAVGRPIVTQVSSAQLEINPIGAFIDDPIYLDGSIEQWADPELRREVYEQSKKAAQAYSLEAICGQYRALFDRVMRQAA